MPPLRHLRGVGSVPLHQSGERKIRQTCLPKSRCAVSAFNPPAAQSHGRSSVSLSVDSVGGFGSGNGFLASGTKPRRHHNKASEWQMARPCVPESLGTTSVLRRRPFPFLSSGGQRDFPRLAFAVNLLGSSFPARPRRSHSLPGDAARFLLRQRDALCRALPTAPLPSLGIAPGLRVGAGRSDHPGLRQHQELSDSSGCSGERSGSCAAVCWGCCGAEGKGEAGRAGGSRQCVVCTGQPPASLRPPALYIQFLGIFPW